MRKLIFLLIVMGIITLSLPAFAVEDKPKEEPNPNFINPRFNIEHIDGVTKVITNQPVILIYDKDTEVVCYVLGKSISCFPFTDLSLKGGNFILQNFPH